MHAELSPGGAAPSPTFQGAADNQHTNREIPLAHQLDQQLDHQLDLSPDARTLLAVNTAQRPRIDRDGLGDRTGTSSHADTPRSAGQRLTACA